MNNDLSYNIKLGLATNIKNKNAFNVIINYILELEKENERLKTIIKEIDDYCVKTNGTDRKKGDLDLNYNYICGWNAGKDEVCTQISFILDKENKQ